MQTKSALDTSWPLFRSAAYLKGRGVSFGSPLIPQAAVAQGVYSICFALARGQGVAAFDSQLSVIADNSLDHIYIGPMIEAVDEPADLVREASRKLRLGGHLVLHLNLGREEAGVHRFEAVDADRWLSPLARWQSKGLYVKDGVYLQILKKCEGSRGVVPAKPREGRRACIVRYGALGDAIVMTPLVRRLAEEGYEVTLNIASYCAPVFENNPHVSNILIQEKDLIPNHLLGDYWQLWHSEYDRYINLSESIEGDLLQIEGRPGFFTSKAWRVAQGDHNYYEYTLERGGCEVREDDPPRGELYFTRAEERRAEKFFSPLRDKFTILWALNGSSHHKVYPMLEPTLREWFSRHSDSRVITVGDHMAKLLEFDHEQLIPRAGEWSVRESLIATKYADLVIGPETMITNAAGCFPTPKIVLLSHSSKNALTKHFENNFSIEPDTSIAQCWPCFSLHYTKESCPIGQVIDTNSGEAIAEAPICATAILPTRLLSQMEEIYTRWAEARQPMEEVTT